MGRVKDVTTTGRPAGEGNDGYQGPTYADVRAMAYAMEKERCTRISFRIDPSDVFMGWKAPQLHVRACAHLLSDGEAGAVWSSATFGGNRGSKTLPGAMVAALYELDEKLAKSWLDGVTVPVE